MITVRNFNETPPGNWRYLVPETNEWFRNYSAYNDLESAVARHYKANRLPVPNDLRTAIVEQLCKTLPVEWCEDSTHPLRIGFSAPNEFSRVIQGTATLFDWFILGNREKVSLEVATARAATCVQCIFNQPPAGCTGCNAGALARVAEGIVGGDPVPYSGQLNACQICGCQLRAKIWLPDAVLQRHISQRQLAQFPGPSGAFPGCWLAQ